MPLITIIIAIVLIAIVMWAVNTYVPLQATLKKILNVTVAVVVVIWLLKVLGAWDYLSKIHV